ncbi:MAG TPA: SBBP repeat-containing protein [Bacteroidia bacterium]|nr:SBBP repeat-containing protein [Bacteroidia bacterium]
MKPSSLLLATLLLLPIATAHAADPVAEWVSGGGGAASDKTRAVAFDREGNVLIAGETTDDGTFGEAKRTGLGKMDSFLAKLSKDGRFLWVRSFGGSLADRAYGVVADADGNIYTTGHYESTDAQVDGATVPNQGEYDIFVAKYSPDGDLLWLRTAGGKGYDYGHAIAIDGRGDLIVSGAIVGEATFGDQTVSMDGTGRPIFCAKYSPSGDLRWVKTTSGSFSGSGTGVGVDAQDCIYIGGSGSGSGAMGTLAIDAGKTQSAVVLKLDPEGNGVWFAAVGGTPSAGFHEISVDAEGRVWGAGMFKGDLLLPDGTVSSQDAKDNDGFLASFAADGKLRWAKTLQSPGTTDYCLGVATDGSGNCFVTGEFSATATFCGREFVTRGSTDILTAALDDKGDPLWILQDGGEKGDNAYVIAWHPDGKLVIAGACVAPATFGDKTLETSGSADAYAAVYRVK